MKQRKATRAFCARTTPARILADIHRIGKAAPGTVGTTLPGTSFPLLLFPLDT